MDNSTSDQFLTSSQAVRIKAYSPEMRRDIVSFLQYLRTVRCLSAHTCYDYSCIAFRFAEYLKENKINSFSNLKAVHALGFFNSQHGLSKSSYIVIKAALVSIFEWCYMNSLVNYEEFVKIKMIKRGSAAPVKIVGQEAKVLKDEELSVIFAYINEKFPYSNRSVYRANQGMTIGKRHISSFRRSLMNVQLKAIVIIALETGLRKTEIFNLKTSDLDPDNRSIVTIGKGNKRRVVPYTSLAKEYAKKWLAHRELMSPDHDHVWCSARLMGQQIQHSSFEKWIDNMPGASWHDFRRTFATRTKQAGVDTFTLSKVLGHSSEQTTAIYLGLQDQEILEEMEVFEDIRSEKFRKIVEENIS